MPGAPGTLPVRGLMRPCSVAGSCSVMRVRPICASAAAPRPQVPGNAPAYYTSSNLKHLPQSRTIPPDQGKPDRESGLDRESELDPGPQPLRIGYVSQSPWLVSGSVRENIVMGAPWDGRRYQQVGSTWRCQSHCW
jgi:hypothetical protein